MKIAILDTGIRSTHQDICGKVTLQKNFYDGSADAHDDHGHGTHVAGIAGACADNQGQGIVGERPAGNQEAPDIRQHSCQK